MDGVALPSKEKIPRLECFKLYGYIKHIHLLVFDNGRRNTIPDSIKLIAGRTGQEYNIRKNRRGAFWQDRYHATAVESNRHLRQCITYIDFDRLMELLGFKTHEQLRQAHFKWVDSAIQAEHKDRETKWTHSIAVGSQSFIEKIKEALGFRVRGRKIRRAGDSFELRETLKPYGATNDLEPGNTFLWDQ